MTDSSDPWLLTPGPLTTSLSVKQTMLHDWGSRDHSFIEVNRLVRDKLVALAGASGSHECVPVQGSGTFAIEATLGTLTAPGDRILILVNGAYGQRAARICDYYRRPSLILECAEDEAVDVRLVNELLAENDDIGHVFAVHCETTSGILNPIAEIAATVQRHGRKLIIDAMSAFGAIALDTGDVPFTALVASANKCLEGVPGMAFAIIQRSVLENCAGNSPSLSLDLYDQWRAMERNGQWRFTPPTHVIFALHQALLEHEAEGGVSGRGRRYRDNCDTLVGGMRAMGFTPLLEDRLQAPIIVTFRMPADPRFDFQIFYDKLNALGFVIYPGKLTVADSFRIGCIGRLGRPEIEAALAAIRGVIGDMGVRHCGPGAVTKTRSIKG